MQEGKPLFDTYRLLGPLLRLIEPERAHDFTLKALELGRSRRRTERERPSLAMVSFGLDFPNPLGLAAGFDKNGRVTAGMLASGFGFVEVGTVTPRPQAGNPRPRVFRLAEDRAVINRLGFNNEGMDRVADRLVRRDPDAGIVGVNIGMNRDSGDAADDYRRAFAKLAPLADYVVINVSSPNTPGLRDLQSVRNLERILGALADVRNIVAGAPLLLKLAPDLTIEDARDAATVAADHGVAGLVISNTTTSRPPGLKGRNVNQTGGLSGSPLFKLSTELLRNVYRVRGEALPIIGTGGVASADDAYLKIRAGASLVQLYTALVWQGTAAVGRILDGLEQRLARDGLKHLKDAVGMDA